jgi:hypothetical protein
MAIDLNIRSSSFPRFLDCPARWKATNIDKISMPSSGPAWLGTSLHAGTGAFDQARVEGQPISTDDAVDIVQDSLKNPKEEVRWDNQLTLRKARDVAAPLTIDYCNRISPAYTYEAVELKCEPLTINMGEGVTITITGTADRVQVRDTADWWEEQPARGICDVKSGRSVVKNGEVSVDKHVAQLGAYELLEIMVKRQTGQEMILPAEIIAMPTSGSDRTVAVGTVDRPSRVLLGEGHHMGLLRTIAKMAKHDLFPGIPSSMLCSERYCPIYPCWWTGKTK